MSIEWRSMFRYICAWLQALFGYINAWLPVQTEDPPDPVTVWLGPMGHLFQQLRSAIDWQYTGLKGVKIQIQTLGEGLEGLCSDLKELCEAEDTITRCWVRQVRDLCYDTSDYLDDLMHFTHCSSRTRRLRTRLSWESRRGYEIKIFRVSRRPVLCSMPKAKKLKLLHQIVNLPMKKLKPVPLIHKSSIVKLKRVPLIAKLSALAARVEDAHERRTRLKFCPPQASKKNYAQAESVSHIKPQLPLQSHVDNLIKLLRERNPKVVTIFGSASAGMTAVARTLYHQYRGRFQYRALLRVSRNPDMRKLLADLLSQIKAPPAHAFYDVKRLTASITKHLQGKSFLIVIEDLWDTSTWDVISRALPDGGYCKIITTTEVEDVALACCSDQSKHIYEINHDQLGISEGGSTAGMKEALNLVYNNLPPHLKTCLLYLNIYPEGWTVKKYELVKQWVAEGFIGSVQGQDAEETAGCYFDALVSTGMIQSVDTNQNNEVLSSILHHTVLDLIRERSIEENFVTIVNYFHTTLGLPDKVRRLSVQSGGAKDANNISGNMRISQVRSLIFFGFLKCVPSIMEYRLLQVLILHIWSDQDRIFDLTTIGELYRLRYLKIECSITVKLPRKIRRLQQLVTLQVDARLYAVPSDIIHLEKLLHLRFWSESILPHGVGRMTCLRTLGSFDLGRNSEDNVRDLGELKHLQDLQLTCSATDSLEKNVQLLLGSVLKQLSMLQSVTLVPATVCSNVNARQDFADASSMIVSFDSSSSVSPAPDHLRRLELSRRCCLFSKLPKWLGELAQLCILKIAVVELLKEDIGIMSGLPAMASLSLHVSTRSTEMIVFGIEGFSVLRYFKFTCSVPWMNFEAGAMPNLEKLKLCFSLPVQSIVIKRLSGLKEISAIIGGAGIDVEPACKESIENDPGNPKVQLMGSIYYGEQDRGMDTREGSREYENSEANIR
ncbi:unnamed protein product [Alopecurus aequalis]